jgi:AcrR family transcriptional regulator
VQAPSIPEPRRGGRPRSGKARAAILKATAELFQEQHLRSISMDAVAQRAGVSKATIYRWWTSKGTLALDAFMAELTAATGTPPDKGSLMADLKAHMRALVASYGGTPAGKMLAELVGAFPTDPELAEGFRTGVVARFRQQHRVIFERAIARGEIAANTDTDIAMDLLYGAIWIRLLLGMRALDDRFADRVVEIAVRGLRVG